MTNMLKRLESDLKIVHTRNPLQTVEVDLGCIPDIGYNDLVVKALKPIAVKYPKMRATIYVYQGPSVNFQQQTWSAFFGSAGATKLLIVLLNAFRAANVANVKISESLNPSEATMDYHVQDGRVWLPYEEGAWYTDAQDELKNIE